MIELFCFLVPGIAGAFIGRKLALTMKIKNPGPGMAAVIGWIFGLMAGYLFFIFFMQL